MARVETASEHVLAGDAFQIVISQRLTAQTGAAPFQIYRALRISNPSPYMFFFDADGFQLIGSSPEVLVKLHRRKATLSPIAGTRPRGRTPLEDHGAGRRTPRETRKSAPNTSCWSTWAATISAVCARSGRSAPNR